VAQGGLQKQAEKHEQDREEEHVPKSDAEAECVKTHSPPAFRRGEG
jgi:hypothetical protein